ncbi:MAG: hypothetical protein LBG92_10285 [Prevotellaceae bacterium]|nr:hypothetical protein [Prevotellaceae bacterium]
MAQVKKPRIISGDCGETQALFARNHIYAKIWADFGLYSNSQKTVNSKLCESGVKMSRRDKIFLTAGER